MRIPFLLLPLFLASGFSGLCSLPPGEDDLVPSLQVAWKKLEVGREHPEDDPERNWRIGLGGIVAVPSGWEIDWVEDELMGVAVEDSTGRKASRAKCYSSSFDRKTAHLLVEPQDWLPSAGTQWVEVKGELPLVISCREAVSEPVALKLEKGASVPLVLKGAGIGKDGKARDVRVKLVIRKYGDAALGREWEGENKKMLEVEVDADEPLGIRDFVLQAVDGTPVAAEMCGWSTLGREWKIDPVMEGKLQVAVRYSQHLQRCKALIDRRAALAGFREGKTGKGRGPGSGFSETGHSAMKSGGISSSEGGLPVDESRPSVAAEVTRLIVERVDAEEAGEDVMQMVFEIELTSKTAAVFGGGADMWEQSLEVTDSTGRVLSPAMFDLTWLKSRNLEKGQAMISLCGTSPEPASPGAEWIRIRGTLHVPVGVKRESPVYELPLQKGAELQIPVPGMSGSGGGGHDVAASGDVPVCRLKLEGVKEQGNGDLHAQVSLQVEGVPFDLECFEVVDDKGFPLKNAVSASGGAFMGPLGQERFWHQRFKFKGGADTERLHVRLKYRADAETVAVPVDCTIGPGGPLL